MPNSTKRDQKEALFVAPTGLGHVFESGVRLEEVERPLHVLRAQLFHTHLGGLPTLPWPRIGPRWADGGLKSTEIA